MKLLIHKSSPVSTSNKSWTLFKTLRPETTGESPHVKISLTPSRMCSAESLFCLVCTQSYDHVGIQQGERLGYGNHHGRMRLRLQPVLCIERHRPWKGVNILGRTRSNEVVNYCGTTIYQPLTHVYVLTRVRSSGLREESTHVGLTVGILVLDLFTNNKIL